MIVEAPSFEHLAAMSDGVGTFEHADHAAPRRSGGYCTDDMARLLVVAVLDPEPTPMSAALARMAFWFVADAQGVSGQVRNRRSQGGRWSDRRGVEDSWGRSMWAFGTAARYAHVDWMRQSSMSYFDRGAQQRSPHRRSMAFAALGAAEVLEHAPGHAPARRLLTGAVTAIGPPRTDDGWPWPEPRLTYANAALCEALIAAGDVLDRPDIRDNGLLLLGWLLERESLNGHLSPTPVGGAGPDDHPPGFDQQPIEVAAIATACARAWRSTGEARWQAGVETAAAWFLGENDVGAVMWDPVTGGAYDGLERDGVNRNQGTESTLALVATMQLVRNLAPVLS